MFSINSKLLYEILTQIRMALGIRKSSYHPVTLEVNPRSTTIRVASVDTVIACQLPFGSRVTSVTVPMCALTRIKSSARHDVAFDSSECQLRIDCWENGEYKSTTCETLAAGDGPAEAEWLISNDRKLGSSLQHAARITDPDASRFSLGCIRLRGQDGQIAATDGRQAFTQSGFSFPLDELLVPAKSLTKLRCLSKCSSISVGRSDEWLSLRMAVGPLRWLVDLKILQEGRFPNVDQCIPQPESSRTILEIGDRDAKFLLRHLERLIGKSAEYSPVTLELGSRPIGAQQVVLRFHSNNRDLLRRLGTTSGNDRETSAPIELSLPGSTCLHGPLRICTDHRYLLTALSLGFRQVHLQAANFPAFCYDHRRNYVWALAHESMGIQPRSHMLTLTTTSDLVAA
jgi:hypothetical protein